MSQHGRWKVEIHLQEGSAHLPLSLSTLSSTLIDKCMHSTICPSTVYDAMASQLLKVTTFVKVANIFARPKKTCTSTITVKAGVWGNLSCYKLFVISEYAPSLMKLSSEFLFWVHLSKNKLHDI